MQHLGLEARTPQKATLTGFAEITQPLLNRSKL